MRLIAKIANILLLKGLALFSFIGKKEAKIVTFLESLFKGSEHKSEPTVISGTNFNEISVLQS